MGVEYINGHFGDTLPLDEAMKEFLNALEDGSVRALHVGTFQEVEKRKRDMAEVTSLTVLKDKVDSIETEIEKLKAKDGTLIINPTMEELKKILGK